MVRLPYPAPVSVRKIPETVSEFALVRLKIPRCLILLFVSQRSADTSYRLHGTHAVDDLQSSVCHGHLISRVPPVHDALAHGTQRIPSLESRFYRWGSLRVASKQLLESSRRNSGCIDGTIESWSLQRVQPRLRRRNHVRLH